MSPVPDCLEEDRLLHATGQVPVSICLMGHTSTAADFSNLSGRTLVFHQFLTFISSHLIASLSYSYSLHQQSSPHLPWPAPTASGPNLFTPTSICAPWDPYWPCNSPQRHPSCTISVNLKEKRGYCCVNYKRSSDSKNCTLNFNIISPRTQEKGQIEGTRYSVSLSSGNQGRTLLQLFPNGQVRPE